MSVFEIHHHDFISQDQAIVRNARKTRWVLLLTAGMMVSEVIAGSITGSMALLADGWHMASHAGAMALTLIAYRLASSERLNSSLSFGAGKVIPLGGYTSAILLALIAVLMAVESFQRLISPQAIAYDEAIIVAGIGLIVNLLSAWILEVGGRDAGHGHHHHHHSGHSHHHDHPAPSAAGDVHDHNLKSAYFHVLADALTSVLAIFALLAGKYFQAPWLDPVMGILGGALILRWAYGLCRETAWELLDGHSTRIGKSQIQSAIESCGAQILDLHIWRIAPGAVACELVVSSNEARGSDYYRRVLADLSLQHLVIEERVPFSRVE